MAIDDWTIVGAIAAIVAAVAASWGLLLHHGKDKRDEEEKLQRLNTSMIQAARDGKNETVQGWLNNGANVNAREKPHNKTALMHAAFRGHVAVVEVLINWEKPVDLDAEDDKGETALWKVTTGKGSLGAKNKITRLLREKGAKPILE